MLVFTFIGYSRSELTVGDANLLNVKLIQSDKDLGEVVLPAYGSKKEKA